MFVVGYGYYVVEEACVVALSSKEGKNRDAGVCELCLGYIIGLV